MIRPKISLCYYPTTTFVVDDNEDFLVSVALLPTGQHHPCRQESQPWKALEFLNQIYRPHPFTHRCLQTSEDRDLDRVTFDFNFRKIHHEIYNPNRFGEIAVVVVDYAMPALHGLDFCAQLEEGTIKRMILTSEAGQGLAVQAFNDGLIDKFIKKSMPELTTVLIQHLEELQKKYFLNLSDLALSHTTHLGKPQPVCLSDPVFVDVFTDLCKTHQTVEYYLLDEHGSFLFLDAKAHPGWLIVKSEQDMENLYQYAKDQDAPREILELLQQRTHVPYFHTQEDLHVPFDPCRAYLHPATRLSGQHNYYYAYLQDTPLYPLQRDKILSFQDYLDQR